VDRVAANEPACDLNPDQCAGNLTRCRRAEHDRSRPNDTHRDRVVEGIAALTSWSAPVQPPKSENCRRLTHVEPATGLTDRYDTYGLRMCRMLPPTRMSAMSLGRCLPGCAWAAGRGPAATGVVTYVRSRTGLPVETTHDHVRRIMSAQRDDTCDSLLCVRIPQCRTKYQ
jgi:hypothetical protein